jgi:hypothetical protein
MGYSANPCPYISFVIGFRNDNYTKNAIQKLNTSIKVLIDQLENVSLNSEIIIVDWNSPDPSKPLLNEINISDKSSHVSLHLYEVDGKFHTNYKGNLNKGLIGEVCANVGIRRSRGLFVVNKTGDTFYSDALIKFLSKENLKKDLVYRLDRIDVNSELPLPIQWENHFKKNIIKRKSSLKNTIHTKSAGDFILMHREKWFKIRGFPESNKVTENVSDAEAIYAAIGAGAHQEYLKGDICIFKLAHENMYDSRLGLEVNKPKFYRKIIGSDNRNFFQKAIVFVARLVMGILNLPKTELAGIRVRSIYRFFIVAYFRRIFFGAGFLYKKDWGLANEDFEKKVIIKAKWDF